MMENYESEEELPFTIPKARRSVTQPVTPKLADSESGEELPFTKPLSHRDATEPGAPKPDLPELDQGEPAKSSTARYQLKFPDETNGEPPSIRERSSRGPTSPSSGVKISWKAGGKRRARLGEPIESAGDYQYQQKNADMVVPNKPKAREPVSQPKPKDENISEFNPIAARQSRPYGVSTPGEKTSTSTIKAKLIFKPQLPTRTKEPSKVQQASKEPLKSQQAPKDQHTRILDDPINLEADFIPRERRPYAKNPVPERFSTSQAHPEPQKSPRGPREQPKKPAPEKFSTSYAYPEPQTSPRGPREQPKEQQNPREGYRAEEPAPQPSAAKAKDEQAKPDAREPPVDRTPGRVFVSIWRSARSKKLGACLFIQTGTEPSTSSLIIRRQRKRNPTIGPPYDEIVTLVDNTKPYYGGGANTEANIIYETCIFSMTAADPRAAFLEVVGDMDVAEAVRRLQTWEFVVLMANVLRTMVAQAGAVLTEFSSVEKLEEELKELKLDDAPGVNKEYLQDYMEKRNGQY
ncbi:MAG: hypothetical protein M1829_002928 [Trizodia sp. TS-e1964]|nr:MAG: hypothetical protein M1829_002928 [Trizodia sp. TS-e1964]